MQTLEMTSVTLSHFVILLVLLRRCSKAFVTRQHRVVEAETVTMWAWS